MSGDIASLEQAFREAIAARYRLDRQIGQGGMAVVHLAHDLKHNRQVAIKLLRPELTLGWSTTRFAREIAIAARLNHPHIVPLLDSGEAAGALFYVMPYVEGESLRERLKRQPQLPVDEALQIAQEIAGALAFAHERGIVHRDIKPENILIQSGQAIVADFGIAHAITTVGGERVTATGLVVGTPAYMSPEQASGDRMVDARSDIYSLACVLYEMLAGRSPFVGASAREVFARHSLDPVPSLRAARPSVSASLERALERGLAKVPADRFATASDFSRALSAGVIGAPRVPTWAAVLGLIGVLTIVMAAIATKDRLVDLWGGRSHRLNADLVAIAPFDVYDAKLELWREGTVDVLSAALNDAGALRTVPPTVVIRGWKGPGDARTATELGHRTGARLALIGRLVPAGADSVRLQATLYDVGLNMSRAEVSVRDATDRMDRALDSLAVTVLREIRGARSSSTIHAASLGSASLPALKAFLRGEQFFRGTGWDSAMAYYRRAIAADSNFAIVWRRMSRTTGWHTNNDDTLAQAYGLRAGGLNHGLSIRDSILVLAESLGRATSLQFADPSSRDHQERLYATLEAATRRYPQDPEIAYEFGEALYHFPKAGHTRWEDALREFDRAITLDSAFAPAYIHPIEMAVLVHKPSLARAYVNAYLARRPTDIYFDGLRLISPAFDGHVSDEDIARASVGGLVHGGFAAEHLADRGEAAVRIARSLVKRPLTGDEFLDSPVTRDVRFAMSLMNRGHLREVAENKPERFPVLLAQLLLLGAPLPDSADRSLRQFLQVHQLPAGSDRFFLTRLATLPWIAQKRDTLLLARFASGWDSLSQTVHSRELKAWAEYSAHVGRAYESLARADTTDALRRFDALRDTVCECVFDRITHARLLASRSRWRDAADQLDVPVRSRWFAADGLLDIERARVAERLGNMETAAQAYRHVADLWANADPVLQVYVTEAVTALRRIQRPMQNR